MDYKTTYHTVVVILHEEDEAYEYIDGLSTKARRLWNYVMYLIKQIYLSYNKNPNKYNKDEKYVRDLVNKALNQIKENKIQNNKKKKKKTQIKEYKPENILTDEFLVNQVLRTLNNKNYKSLPAQTSNEIIKKVTQNWKSYFGLYNKYKSDPRHNQKPNKPGYINKKHKRGEKNEAKAPVIFTNQQVQIKSVQKQNKFGIPKYTENKYLTLPKTNKTVYLGKAVNYLTDNIKEDSQLKTVEFIPKVNYYEVHLKFESTSIQKIPKKDPERIMSIDLGVKNFATVGNNIGEPSILIKGDQLISTNQWVSKNLASKISNRTQGFSQEEIIENLKGITLTSKESALIDYRTRFFRDEIHKMCKYLITRAKSLNIDTIVVGYNKDWKRNSKLGKRNNQNFNTLPYKRFKDTLKYLCELEGINYREQEESYTSQSSFLDNDPIPIYNRNNKNNQQIQFSGRRLQKDSKDPTSTNSKFYITSTGFKINADINGAMNILRKAFPGKIDTQSEQSLKTITTIDVWDFNTFHTPKKPKQKQKTA